MDLQIKKPSGEDGLDIALGDALTDPNFSISPEIYARHIKWEYLGADEIKQAQSPEVRFPIDALPGVMRNAVIEAVNFNQCPIPIAVAVALGALSASAQAHFDVCRDENQISPISLSLITIAESGERKTSTDKPFAKCFHEWEMNQRKDYSAELEIYKNQLKAYEIATKEVGKGESNQDALYAAISELRVPVKPIQRTILQDRVTIEKLISNLAGFPIAYMNSNEAGALLGGYAFKTENFQSTITTLNQLWDGAPMKYDTKGGNLLLIPKPRVTVNLLLQESIYRNFSDGNDGLAFSTGGLSRFLVSQPESTIGSRPYKKAPMGLPAIAEFNDLIRTFLSKPAVFEEDMLQTKVLPLAPEAMEAWIAFHDQIERELGEAGEFYMIRGWGSKAPEQVARVAANFQLAVSKDPQVVELDSVQRAIRVVSYYLNESLRLSTSSKSKDSARVLNWLVKRAKRLKERWVLRSQIQQYIHNDLRNAKKIDEALLALEDSGFIHCIVVEGKENVFLNPHLLVTI